MLSAVLRIVPQSVAARLYLVAALAVVAVAGLAAAAITYARHTGHAVTQLHEEGILAASLAGEVALLLERHRRLIETVKPSVDLQSMKVRSAEADEIGAAIEARASLPGDAFMDSIAASVPALIGNSRRVLFLLAQGDRSEAEAAMAGYVKIASRMQDQIELHRSGRVDVATAEAKALVSQGTRLTAQVLTLAFGALLLVGPLTVVIIRDIAGRLRLITATMTQLAGDNLSVSVPVTDDRDEVGDMARAVAVFKANALALMEKKKDIERLNGWFDIALNNMSRGLSMFDGDRRLLVCNKSYRDLYDLPAEIATPGALLPDIAAYWAQHNPGAAAAALPQWSLGKSGQNAVPGFSSS
jgi:PAS domain-containing protein